MHLIAVISVEEMCNLEWAWEIGCIEHKLEENWGREKEWERERQFWIIAQSSSKLTEAENNIGFCWVPLNPSTGTHQSYINYNLKYPKST